jgi:diaminohydroxyphosphoribosylaminopyrimidine deaminase/5-amino-6-(5-phosphoribosylamino)uracil reductase
MRGRRVILCVDRDVASRHKEKVRRLQEKGITLMQVPGRNGFLPLRAVLRALGCLSIGSVLVEGGAKVFQQFVHGRLFDELSVFVAPSIMGDGIPAFSPWNQFSPPSLQSSELHGLTARKIGDDILLHAYKGR